MKPARARRLALGALVLLAAQTGSASTLERAQGGAPSVSPAQPPASSPVRRPAARLRLESPDRGGERGPALKLTTTLVAGAEASAEQRAAAVARWQAINAQPEDLLRTAQRVQALDKDIQGVRETMLRNDARLTDLRGQLERVQRERYASGLVYSLLAALLAGAAAAVFLWRRRRRQVEMPDWWRSQTLTGPDTGFGFEALTTAARVPNTAPVPLSPVDVDLNSFERRAGLHGIDAEGLSDIQQQADFFVSLGEYEQAVEVLRRHIVACPTASPMAWLDLLDIFHKLQRRGDYEEVRGEFQRAFNAQVPSFDAYRDEAHGLEAYPQALSRIQALWPSRRVLDVIEDSVFRQPGEGAEAFGLQAYRELLLLHGIASELVEPQADADAGDAAGPLSVFMRTHVQPLSASMAWKAQAGAQLAPIGFTDIGLDINLEEMAAQAAEAGRP
ncbi:hypothetical protein [Ramlibacter tataouinensis]|nr:hypothetical protein [Ramlibacter tataouinensis]